MEGEQPQLSDTVDEPMPPPSFAPVATAAVPVWVRVLAGIETGVLGAGFMCVWLFAHSWWGGDRFLTPAKIWATTLLGGSVMRYGPGRPLVGLAVHFSLACVVSVVFAVLSVRIRRFPVAVVMGLLAGGCWYFLLVWWNRWIAVYSQQPETFLGFLVFGIVLSRSPSRCIHLAGVLASAD